jgi:RimJ/RimL family protein N-acetyltransferase
MTIALRTQRLLLREWRDSDAGPFAALSADPAAMKLLLGPYDRPASDRWMGWARDYWREHGFGQWVVEIPGVAPFIGVIGLNTLTFPAPFTPAVEVAWRLVTTYWGRGYALEAARASIEDGFFRLGFDEIIAITTPANERSWRLMERLGMSRDPREDFDHPRVPDGHALKRHVLYRLRRPALYV